MKTTLIITTYNWKEALRLSLNSVFSQTVLPYEIVVADDGSSVDTEEMITRIAKQSPVPIHHCWQEDRGFRLARSRNLALARARGDYVILIDGDIILESHFVEDHHRFARAGYFVQGTRVLLSKKLSKRVLAEGVLRAGFCTRGVENRKNCLRSTLLARIFSFQSRSLSGIRTCNFAFWLADALRVNGFNERFVGWGREDSEFTARLMHSGVRRQNVKFNALAYHLYHPINDRDHLKTNDRILEETLNNRLRWCDCGVDQHLQPAQKKRRTQPSR